MHAHTHIHTYSYTHTHTHEQVRDARVQQVDGGQAEEEEGTTTDPTRTLFQLVTACADRKVLPLSHTPSLAHSLDNTHKLCICTSHELLIHTHHKLYTSLDNTHTLPLPHTNAISRVIAITKVVHRCKEKRELISVWGGTLPVSEQVNICDYNWHAILQVRVLHVNVAMPA